MTTAAPTEYTTTPLPGTPFAIAIPKPVGFWVLYPGVDPVTMLAVYKRPTDEQIENTEALLGWGWKDAA